MPNTNVLDTARIGRDTLQAQSLKFYLRKKRGIELVFLQLPRTGSYMDEAIERMMETWDQLHSQVSKDKGVEGQRQNVRRGYRAGGEAPYGYRRRVVTIGQHRTGQPITKSTNEPDRETAPVVQEYFRRRAGGEGRRPSSAISSEERSGHREGMRDGPRPPPGVSNRTSPPTLATSCTAG